MTEKININELFENAMKDPSMLSTIDIDKLLETIENDKHNYLENKTMKTITNEIYETIQKIQISQKIRFEYCQKLVGYRLVDDVYELHKGKHIRWIRESSPNLTNGGIVVDIKFLDSGTHILCKGSTNRFIQLEWMIVLYFKK